jgi:hypothetical protein
MKSGDPGSPEPSAVNLIAFLRSTVRTWSSAAVDRWRTERIRWDVILLGGASRSCLDLLVANDQDALER